MSLHPRLPGGLERQGIQSWPVVAAPIPQSFGAVTRDPNEGERPMGELGQDPRLRKASRYSKGKLKADYQRKLDAVAEADERGLRNTEFRKRLEMASEYDPDGVKK
jgi:hypothetical protein